MSGTNGTWITTYECVSLRSGYKKKWRPVEKDGSIQRTGGQRWVGPYDAEEHVAGERVQHTRTDLFEVVAPKPRRCGARGGGEHQYAWNCVRLDGHPGNGDRVYGGCTPERAEADRLDAEAKLK